MRWCTIIDLRVLITAGAALPQPSLLVYATIHALNITSVPRSSVLVYWFIAFAYMVSSALSWRARCLRRSLKPTGRAPLRTAIYRTGDAGAQLTYSMAFSTEYRPVCFIDDRSTLQRDGGRPACLRAPTISPEAVFRHEIDQIVVAIPSASSAQKRRLIERVEGAGCR